MANKIKLKRGLAADVDSLTLESGELAVVLDSRKLKVGDENGIVRDIEAVSADTAKKTSGTLTITQDGVNKGTFDGSINKTLEIQSESALATFEISSDGHLYATGDGTGSTEKYNIGEDGHLYLTLNGSEKDLGIVKGDTALASFEIHEDGCLYAIGNSASDVDSYFIRDGYLMLSLNDAEKNLGYVVGPKPDMSNYYTKTEVQQYVAAALDAVPIVDDLEV